MLQVYCLKSGKSRISVGSPGKNPAGYSEDVTDQLALLSLVMTEAQMSQVELDNKFQVDPRMYVDVCELLPKYELLQQEEANTAQELTDLRDLVFHQQENMYLDNEPDDQISFPYHTQNRIVVFGGHETWSREMRPKLPDVRFVDRTMVPNADMIRRADVVWIQTNAISHGYYYKIIDEVRKYDVRVRYFSYASAQKCAEQIVADEKAMNQ